MYVKQQKLERTVCGVVTTTKKSPNHTLETTENCVVSLRFHRLLVTTIKGKQSVPCVNIDCVRIERWLKVYSYVKVNLISVISVF